MKIWRWGFGMSLAASASVLLLLAALGGTITSTAASAAGHSETCRVITGALMSGDIDAAAAVAASITLSDRKTLRGQMSRFNDALIGIVGGKRARLERTLADIDVENHPVSLQIWSFSDQEVYFVGCLLRIDRINQGKAQFELQLNNSVDEIINGIRTKLDQPPDEHSPPGRRSPVYKQTL